MKYFLLIMVFISTLNLRAVSQEEPDFRCMEFGGFSYDIYLNNSTADILVFDENLDPVDSLQTGFKSQHFESYGKTMFTFYQGVYKKGTLDNVVAFFEFFGKDFSQANGRYFRGGQHDIQCYPVNYNIMVD